MACTFFRVLLLACDGKRRGDPNDLEGGKNKHQSLFAYFERKPQKEGTSVTRELVSCILDDVFVKVTETDDKKKHGIESDSGKLIYSWNEES